MLIPLSYPQTIQWIASYMMDSDQSWYRLTYYRPLNALVMIATENYMQIDEPGIMKQLEKESRAMVKEFTAGSDNFVVFPSLKDEERIATIKEYISEFPSEKREQLVAKWEEEEPHIIDNWRPGSVYRLFSTDEEMQHWDEAICKKLSPAIHAFAEKNGINLRKISSKYLK